MAKPRSLGSRNSRSNPHGAETAMLAALDDLAEFEDYKRTVLKSIKDDIKAGLTAPQIYKKYEAMVAARTVSIALTEKSPKDVTPLLKDISDRAGGRAVERQIVVNPHANMTDEEVRALLQSRLAEFEAVDANEVLPHQLLPETEKH